jgi:glutamate racemase
MDNRPIGVFDSGVGGLTAVRELHQILPREDIIYFGDIGRVPYGSRSRETLRTYASQIINFLCAKDIKALIVACGSISSNLAGEDIAGQTPCVTVLNSAVSMAAKATDNNKVGVIATAATIRTGMFERRLCELNPKIQPLGQSCPLLVPVIENGLVDFGNQITRLTLEMYLKPIQDFGADTLILGCTHYPLVSDIIADMMGAGVTLIDAGKCAAGELKTTLEEQNLQSDREAGKTTYYVTDGVSGFAGNAQNFLGEDITDNCIQIGLTEIGGY